MTENIVLGISLVKIGADGICWYLNDRYMYIRSASFSILELHSAMSYWSWEDGYGPSL